MSAFNFFLFLWLIYAINSVEIGQAQHMTRYTVLFYCELIQVGKVFDFLGKSRMSERMYNRSKVCEYLVTPKNHVFIRG